MNSIHLWIAIEYDSSKKNGAIFSDPRKREKRLHMTSRVILQTKKRRNVMARISGGKASEFREC